MHYHVTAIPSTLILLWLLPKLKSLSLLKLNNHNDQKHLPIMDLQLSLVSQYILHKKHLSQVSQSSLFHYKIHTSCEHNDQDV